MIYKAYEYSMCITDLIPLYTGLGNNEIDYSNMQKGASSR